MQERKAGLTGNGKELGMNLDMQKLCQQDMEGIRHIE